MAAPPDRSRPSSSTATTTPSCPLVNARLIACRVPDARLQVVEGGGHLLLLDSAADVVPLITAFLTRTTHRTT